MPEVVASTLYDNDALGGNAGSGGSGGSGLGGAIYNDGGTVRLRNATLSTNSAASGTGGAPLTSRGGAIYTANGLLTAHNSTITNSTANTGRGIYVFATGGISTAEIHSTIIAQADAPAFARDFVALAELDGTLFISGANNLIRTQNGFHEIAVASDAPMLGPLAYNGGPTLTHALHTESPANNIGSNPLNLVADQRGPTYSRVIGSAADIGAFEVQSVVSPALPGDYNRDDAVDVADYVLWRKTIGTEVEMFAGADGSGNEFIDDDDYTMWAERYGETLPSVARAIATVFDIAAATNEPDATYRSNAAVAKSAADKRNAFIPRSLAFASLATLTPRNEPFLLPRASVVSTNGPSITSRSSSVVRRQAQGDALLAVMADRSWVARPNSGDAGKHLAGVGSASMEVVVDTALTELNCDLKNSVLNADEGSSPRVTHAKSDQHREVSAF